MSLHVASVVDQVYLVIREQISDGSLPRGGRLHQEELEQVGEQPAVTAQTLHVALAMPEDEAEREVEVSGAG